MDVFNHNLEPIEAPRLGNLNVIAEAFDEVLVDNTIRRGEEGENVGNEVALVFRQFVVPVILILRKVDLFSGPEGRFGLFVELPNLDISVDIGANERGMSWNRGIKMFKVIPGIPIDHVSVHKHVVLNTYLVVLDGEEYESLGVGLENGLLFVGIATGEVFGDQMNLLAGEHFFDLGLLLLGLFRNDLGLLGILDLQLGEQSGGLLARGCGNVGILGLEHVCDE
ncbi:LOW QUALITY PROTEIN: hypothetical protein BC938DRAFT_475773 [Jimgerdemannia flammicorona]|uniref:Uncharacterized protein n=1 Tax=Jimgerdemannia flammicorona TaxID=994334 RepID=A0A433QR82_9FUNG|nr:LOW QUALITY PROTEIN: hypothetical protein BC938DRAFT_475773 [Jimgerdemannia flammicorona]